MSKRSAGLGWALVPMLLLVAVVNGCSSDKEGSDNTKPAKSAPVLATTAIWADVISSATCHAIPVDSLVPAGSDTHDFELSLHASDQVLESRVVFTNGLGLDASFTPVLDMARDAGVEVVDLGAAMDSDMPPIAGDPHFWMEPERVRGVVGVVAAKLKPLELMDSTELDRCAKQYSGDLTDLTTLMAREMEVIPSSRRKLVTEHHNMGYFAQRFDFEVLGAMNDASGSLAETDARHLEKLRVLMTSAGIDTVFVQAGESNDKAESLARDVSVNGEVVPLYIETPPKTVDTSADAGGIISSTYVQMMTVNAERVAAALSK
ncbi:MAG: zinc ABC transporter substrate-binding protein [Microthrixaceae bacterium]|nr:zinc ABC transporter substrate-binding protein [Microthrixaceae bacterium]